MSRALATRSRAVGRKSGLSTTAIIIAGLVVLVVWLLIKRQSTGTYQNAETWEIVRNEQGFATKLIVHRDASER